VFAYAIGQTGSSQIAVLSVIVFFIVGAFLLTFVDVEHGQRIAREAEADTAAA
jgi:UMF1 family MFS transporter